MVSLAVLSVLLTSLPLISSDLPPDHLRRQHDSCWGHEPKCKQNDLPKPTCQDPTSEAKFYFQADFGYLAGKRATVQPLCAPLDPESPMASSLNCSWNLEFCEGRNLLIDFENAFQSKDNLKYSKEVLLQGGIRGGGCKLDEQLLNSSLDFMSSLQSWAPELRYFEAHESLQCDVIVDKPTVIMKLDAQVNMYHHFCDFFNLYLSLHLNGTSEDNFRNSFDKDFNVIIWEGGQYRSAFEGMFKAFINKPVMNLKSYGGKKVCFKNLLLPLNPRGIFGLFYNTPIVQGCSNSGLFRSFSQFITHRLNIPKRTQTDGTRVKILLLSRLTKHRVVLNEVALVRALEATGKYEVNVARFTHQTPFEDQMAAVHAADVLVGMHGAGLTHVFFLPEWGSLFELHNCGDAACYRDLALMRGVGYVTWEDEDKVVARGEGKTSSGHLDHPKFKSYTFDEAEFVRKVEEAADKARNHPEFQALDTKRHEEL